MRPLRLELTARPLDGAPCRERGGAPPPPEGSPASPSSQPPAEGEEVPEASRPTRRHPSRPLRSYPPPVSSYRGEAPSAPSYPWSRGRDALYCVQHRGDEGADAVPYPIMAHDEAGHDGPCRGPGHDAPGTAKHVLARSAIAAVAYALGVGEQKARYWWEKGWVLVEGAASRRPPEVTPPPGGVILLKRRLWHDPTGRTLLVPPGQPRPRERHYPVIQWCVRAPAGAEAPFPAQVHACQDHRGQPCYPPAPWLPREHHHIHIAAKSPAGALSRALGVARKTAKKLSKRQGALLLEGETAALFAPGRASSSPSSPPPPSWPQEATCLSRGIAISLNLEAPWSCR